MKNLSVFVSVFLLLGFVSIAAAVSENGSSLSGSWEFNVNGAPWEYSRGVLVIERNEDELAGKVEFNTGRVIQITNIFFEDDKLTFETSVDGYDVKTDFTLSEDSLSGYVLTIEGNMNVTATRKSEEK
jgi:hypothetical protein